MAVNQPTQEYLLPCGRDVETVWERLDEVENGRANTHDIQCPNCGAVRESLKVLRDLTGVLAADDIEPSRNLTGRIMAAVRSDVRRRNMLALPTDEPGGVRVSEQAVAAVLRFAADTVGGVRARRCRVRQAASDVLAIEVDMSIAIRAGGFTAAAIEQVRDRVTAAAGARIGVRLARLDLTVEDLYNA